MKTCVSTLIAQFKHFTQIVKDIDGNYVNLRDADWNVSFWTNTVQNNCVCLNSNLVPCNAGCVWRCRLGIISKLRCTVQNCDVVQEFVFEHNVGKIEIEHAPMRDMHECGFNKTSQLAIAFLQQIGNRWPTFGTVMQLVVNCKLQWLAPRGQRNHKSRDRTNYRRCFRQRNVVNIVGFHCLFVPNGNGVSRNGGATDTALALGWAT